MSPLLGTATVASLLGDPSRANILCALLRGDALTAKELAYAARVSPQTASGQLARLSEAGLIVTLRQGRFRYYRLAGRPVAQMLEGIMNVATMRPPRVRPLRMEQPMRQARLCYDHCAGRLGVGMLDSLLRRGLIALGDDCGTVTAAGARFFLAFGLDIEALRRQRRIFCGPCLDWSERRPHLAGALGAALARRLFDLGWIERVHGTRTLMITTPGDTALRHLFGVALGPVAGGAGRAIAAS